MEKTLNYYELITDKEKLSSKLIFASLFIMAYESFLSGWKDQLFHFHADSIIIDNELVYGFYDEKFTNFNDPNLTQYTESKEKENDFNDKVYRLVKNSNGKGYSKDLSLFKYLENMALIDNSDYCKLEEIRNVRNKIVHELNNIIYDNESNNYKELLKDLIRIRKKANENWFREVEIPIAYEDFLDEDGNFIPPEAIYSVRDLIFDVIMSTALNVFNK